MKVRLSLNDEEKNEVQEVYESLTTDQLMGDASNEEIEMQMSPSILHSKLWVKKRIRNIVD